MKKLLTALMLMALATGCVSLPDDGPVQVRPDSGDSAAEGGFPYVPPPPTPGENPDQIVRHFLDAMTASPVQLPIAQKFLSTSAREAWKPERRMVTYSDVTTPTGNTDVDVTLIDANTLDSRGVWGGSLPKSASKITFPMTVENDEWRIDKAPDAMIVPDSWFESQYQQVSLYFFDPTGQILVPEPVFVPQGDQLATSLVTGLLRGPGNPLRGVSRSFIPKGLTLDLSVPVSPDGLADVTLQGDISGLDQETIELMTVQIAWTLRQDPTIERVRLTVGDTPITVPGEGSDFDVNIGQAYDPSGVYAWQDLFGQRNGRMVSSVNGRETRVSGPFGQRDYGLRELSVNLAGTQVVGVTRDGTALRQAPVDVAQGQQVRTLVSGATNLLHPAWDHTDRMWLLDRTADGARVSYVSRGRRVPVRVPGITGERVVEFLVSRDGSRIAAALDRPGSDVVVVSRIVRRDNAVRATRARTVLRGVGEQLQIRDLGWHSPTELTMVSALTNELSEIRTFSVDGSPATQSTDPTNGLLREDVVRMASSPLPERPTWFVAADGTVAQLTPDRDVTPPTVGIRSLTYVG
jgi:lipoprotein LpqB-like beta-propeller protein/sporulation and spore germination protein